MNKKRIVKSNYWWVTETKPQKEDQVIINLNNQGFNVYCPRFLKESLSASQIKVKTAPLFSRYVFIEGNQLAHEKIHAIRSTYGVSKLLKICEVPIQVPSHIILRLKAIETQQTHRVESYFKIGDPIRIREGIYQGLEAIYQIDDGLERAIVLLNILNKETPLNINKGQIQKI